MSVEHTNNKELTILKQQLTALDKRLNTLNNNFTQLDKKIEILMQAITKNNQTIIKIKRRSQYGT